MYQISCKLWILSSAVENRTYFHYNHTDKFVCTCVCVTVGSRSTKMHVTRWWAIAKMWTLHCSSLTYWRKALLQLQLDYRFNSESELTGLSVVGATFYSQKHFSDTFGIRKPSEIEYRALTFIFFVTQEFSWKMYFSSIINCNFRIHKVFGISYSEQTSYHK